MLLKGTVRFLEAHAARLCACGLCGCVFAAHASVTSTEYQPKPFEHYQPILDRMPFGALPTGFGQAAAAVPTQTEAQVQAEQQKLAKQINMSCINITPDGQTAIGFTDLNQKPPVNFYLLVGDTGGGWTVVEADYDGEWAQIEKDGVAITLKLGKGLIEAPPVPAVAKNQAPLTTNAQVTVSADIIPSAETPSIPRPGMVRRPSQTGMPPMPNISAAQMAELAETRAEMTKIQESGGDVHSYMDRLRERNKLENEKRAAAERTAREQLQALARKVTEEELKKQERSMNLKLLEQGATPVSDIELTPEEEAALVEKGALTQ